MTTDLTRSWTEAQQKLPEGWQLDSLRCASTGLDESQRSEDWIAVAVGPDGSERRYRAPDPESALAGLVESI